MLSEEDLVRGCYFIFFTILVPVIGIIEKKLIRYNLKTAELYTIEL
jgi:hypothetical protein